MTVEMKKYIFNSLYAPKKVDQIIRDTPPTFFCNWNEYYKLFLFPSASFFCRVIYVDKETICIFH